MKATRITLGGFVFLVYYSPKKNIPKIEKIGKNLSKNTGKQPPKRIISLIINIEFFSKKTYNIFSKELDIYALRTNKRGV